MISVYQLKSRFQSVLRPTTRALAKADVRPNQVTWAAILLSLAAGAAIAMWPADPRVLWLLPLVLFVRMGLNAIDGMLAREHGMQTRHGAVLNELGDVVSDAALYLPLGLVPGFAPILVALVVVLAVITEVAGLVGLQFGAPRRYDGPCGKSDRAFVIGAVALALGLGVPPGGWLDAAWIGLAIGSVITIFTRSRAALECAR